MIKDKNKLKFEMVAFLVLFAMVACVSIGNAFAATTYYVNPGESIQAAVDSANAGDTNSLSNELPDPRISTGLVQYVWSGRTAYKPVTVTNGGGAGIVEVAFRNESKNKIYDQKYIFLDRQESKRMYLRVGYKWTYYGGVFPNQWITEEIVIWEGKVTASPVELVQNISRLANISVMDISIEKDNMTEYTVYNVLQIKSSGSGKKQINSNDDEPFSLIAWSKEGIFFLLNEKSRPEFFDPFYSPESEIWSMNSEGKDKKQLTSDMKCASAHLSPDGKKIVFISKNESTSVGYPIWIMNSDGSNMTDLNNVGKCIAWSPDGKKLAFCQQAITKGSKVYVMNSDGSNARVLAEHGVWIVAISWSPDSKELVYADGHSFGTVNCETGEREKLTDASSPCWSPNSDMIAYIYQDEIWLIDSAGINTIKLTANGGEVESFKWSPDGEKIAFSTGSYKMKGLWVIDKDSSNEIQLEEGDIQSFCWSHDSKEIAFVSKSSATKPTFKGIYADILFFDKDERIIAFEDVDVDVTINMYRKVGEMEEPLWSKNMTINSYKDATYLFGEGLKIPLEDVEMLKNATVAEVVVHTSKGDFVDTCSGHCLKK